MGIVGRCQLLISIYVRKNKNYPFQTDARSSNGAPPRLARISKLLARSIVPVWQLLRR